MKNMFLTAALLTPLLSLAQTPQVIAVQALSQAPKVDGNLEDWGNDGWIKVPIKPALEKSERAKFGLDAEDDRNQTGSLTLQLKAAVSGGKFYLALKYPDSSADTV